MTGFMNLNIFWHTYISSFVCTQSFGVDSLINKTPELLSFHVSGSLPQLRILVCFLQFLDHCHWALRQHQCTGKDPNGLLLRPHLHHALGEWAEVNAWSSAGRERSSQSARCGSALDNDGSPAGRHPMQVRLDVNQQPSFSLLME